MTVLYWGVHGWNAEARMWTLRSLHSTRAEAVEHAEAHRHRGLRARVVPARGVRKPDVVPDPVPSETRRFREEQAARALERFDAHRYYKSPG